MGSEAGGGSLAPARADGLAGTAGGSSVGRLEPLSIELRRRAVGVLRTSALIFNPIYLGWTVFDWALARDRWAEFLVYRTVVFGLNTATALAVTRPWGRRRSWELMWLWLFLFGAFIAPMLPVVGGQFHAYVLGFAVVLFGAGLVPTWPPVWSVTCVGAMLVAAAAAFVVRPVDVSTADVLAGCFFIATATGISLVAAFFKYDLVRRDYVTRGELQETARRESDARERLSATTAQLEAALARLREEDRRRSMFFANISHELRTPLTLILTPVEDLLRRDLDPWLVDVVAVMQRNARRLLRLIDDLLDLTRLEAGGLRLVPAEVDVCTLARSIVANSLPTARVRGVELELLGPAESTPVWIDAHRIEIVLTNLVGNALKHTPRGGRIEVGVANREDGVAVTVMDTGEGIPPEDLPHVFERFFQVIPGGRHSGGGVGIGLALAKELVDLHGGELTVESTLGSGSAFTLVLPLGRDHLKADVLERRREFIGLAEAKRVGLPDDLAEVRMRPVGDPSAGSREAPARVTVPLPRVGAHRARVVIAEDEGDLRELVAGLLRPGCDVFTAPDGQAALDAIRRERPDLVISDVMMPYLTGIELCRAVREDPSLRATPFILLTARSGAASTLEGFAHGADDYVVKPFDPDELLARVSVQLRLRDLGLQLARHEKLALAGTLAAGVLHELRNPVNAILNSARILATGSRDEAARGRLVEVILDGAERIQGITETLEVHARPAEAGGPAACDVARGIESSLRLLGHRLEGVEVNLELAGEAYARAPAGPVNQVLLNLLDNALRSGARSLWVSLDLVVAGVSVRVADDGPGVPAELVERIFDPFVSTREPGEGTGLGLSLCRRIVGDLGGELWYEDRPGGGAAFVLTLPAIDMGGEG